MKRIILINLLLVAGSSECALSQPLVQVGSRQSVAEAQRMMMRLLQGSGSNSLVPVGQTALIRTGSNSLVPIGGTSVAQISNHAKEEVFKNVGNTKSSGSGSSAGKTIFGSLVGAFSAYMGFGNSSENVAFAYSGDSSIDSSDTSSMSMAGSGSWQGKDMLQYGLAAAGGIALAIGAYKGLVYLYGKDDKAGVIASELTAAFTLFQLNQYASWPEIERRYEKIQQDIRNAHLDPNVAGPVQYTPEDFEAFKAYREAYDVLKKYHDAGKLPYTLKKKLVEEAVQNTLKDKDTRKKALERLDHTKKSSKQITASLEQEREALKVLHGLEVSLAQLKEMVS